MNNEPNIAQKTFKFWKVLLALCFGLGVSFYQFHKGLEGKSIESVFEQLASPVWLWLIAAVVVLLIRDFGYMFRIRHLTNKKLDWKSSFYVILLWEFASAITPSVVGGTAIAVFLLNRHGIKMGRSVAYVTLTAILDNLFFIVVAPFGLLMAQDTAFFSQTRDFFGWFDFRLSYIFFISYALIAFYTSFMAFGVLINPRLFQKLVLLIVKVFHLKGSWKRKAFRLTLDNIEASKALKGLGYSYWVRAVLSTLFVWCARYLMLNCLLAAYLPMDFELHKQAFGKQLVLWVTQLISPTPGASGFAEAFMVQLFGGALIINSITLLWRLFTYYTYLIIGSIIFPRWIEKN